MGTLSTAEDPAHLIVESITSPGLISEWNGIHNPTEHVHVGDAVVSVNGLSGNGFNMQDQINLASRALQKEELYLDIRPLSLQDLRRRQRHAELVAQAQKEM